LAVLPDIDAEPGMCFPNIQKKVAKAGGSVVYGWQLYEYPYMIEAEFHAGKRGAN